MPQLELHDFAPQLIWLVISFVTLYLIMARVALPRIANVLEERRDRIASDLDKAEQLKRKTDEAIAAYEESLAEARNSAHAIAQETRDKLSAEVDAEKAQVEKQIAEKTSKAEARITKAKASALTKINVVAEDVTGAIIKQLIGAKLTKKEVSQAVSKALVS